MKHCKTPGEPWACSRCLVEKPLTAEFFYPRIANGKPAFAARCKPCSYSMKGMKGGREYQMMKAYGLPGRVYLDLLKAQGGGCAICGGKETAANKQQTPYPFAVDHNHITGHTRGLLCSLCNTSLSQFGDSVEGLKRVLAYLIDKDDVMPLVAQALRIELLDP